MLDTGIFHANSSAPASIINVVSVLETKTSCPFSSIQVINPSAIGQILALLAATLHLLKSKILMIGFAPSGIDSWFEFSMIELIPRSIHIVSS
jgi:hypothetical protein